MYDATMVRTKSFVLSGDFSWRWEEVIEVSSKEMKRYNLVLPQILFDELQRIADEKDTTVVEIIKRFIRLGLLVSNAEKSPDMSFVLRRGDREDQLLLL